MTYRDMLMVVGSFEAMTSSGTAAMLVVATTMVAAISPGALTGDFSLTCRRLNDEFDMSELGVR